MIFTWFGSYVHAKLHFKYFNAVIYSNNGLSFFSFLGHNFAKVYNPSKEERKGVNLRKTITKRHKKEKKEMYRKWIGTKATLKEY